MPILNIYLTRLFNAHMRSATGVQINIAERFVSPVLVSRFIAANPGTVDASVRHYLCVLTSQPKQNVPSLPDTVRDHKLLPHVGETQRYAQLPAWLRDPEFSLRGQYRR